MFSFALRALLFFLLLAVPNALRAQGGLDVALTTSGYRFVQGAELTTSATTRSRLGTGPQSFSATASLINLSRSDVLFNFPNPVAAANRWTFRVFDASGAQLWISEDNTGAAVATPVTLHHSVSWRRTVQVPLVVNGAWLPSGKYTLEASIAGDPPLGSSTAFEVQSASTPAGMTGIKGRVQMNLIQPLLAASISPIRLGLGVKATVAITQTGVTGTPFTWTGVTDDSGNYSVTTPAGTFTVSATRFADAEIARPGMASNSVTVTAGSFSVDNLFLINGPIIVTPPVVNPLGTGVTGQVTQAPANDGTGMVQPIVGGTVMLSNITSGPIFRPIIQPVLDSAAAIISTSRVASATTDAQGNYTISANAGTYRIVVFSNATPGVYNATTSMPLLVDTVTILPGKIVTDNLEAPAPISPLAQPIASISSLNFETSQTATIGSVPHTVLAAAGTASTAGWTQAALRPRPSTNPYVLEYDFVAVPPSDVSAQVLTPIYTSVPSPGTGFTVIRVYSATNSKEIDFMLPDAIGLQAQ